MRTNAINLLLAIITANTKFLIFEQLLCIALVILSRIDDDNGNIRTECVINIKGLLETIEKRKRILLINKIINCYIAYDSQLLFVSLFLVLLLSLIKR